MKLGSGILTAKLFVFFLFVHLFFVCPWRRDRRWWRHQKRAGSHRGPYLSSCGRRKFRSSVKIDARYELTAVRPAFNYTAAKALWVRHIGYRGGWTLSGWDSFEDACYTVVVGWEKMKEPKRNETKPKTTQTKTSLWFPSEAPCDC